MIHQDTPAPQQWLVDRVHVEETGLMYGRANDDRDPSQPLWDECMTEDVEVTYIFGSWRGLETHKKMHRAGLLEVFTLTRHALTNPRIVIDGDRASAEFLVHAVHGIATPQGEKIVYGGAIYYQDLIRTAAGWRIKRHRCETTWIDDNGGLLAAVGQSIQDKVGALLNG